MKHDIYVKCDCGCGAAFDIAVRLDATDDYFVAIDTLIPGFYANDWSTIAIIKHRVKAAWYMLRGKEYYLHEVALSKKHWNEFVDAVNEVGKIS